MPQSSRIFIALPVLAVAFVATSLAILSSTAARSDPRDAAAPVLPDLSPIAKLGRISFSRNCASCHGQLGGGTDRGPPLIHRIYEPGHHADIAFQMAIRRGTRQHHWPFGDMPPQPQVSSEETDAIIRFVREVQRANGIQ